MAKVMSSKPSRAKSGRRVSKFGRQRVSDAIDAKVAADAAYGLSASRLRRANDPRNRQQSGSDSERGEVSSISCTDCTQGHCQETEIRTFRKCH